MAKCEICGAELQDSSQRFCGGDRCHRVFMKHLEQGPPGSRPPSSTRLDETAQTDLPHGRLKVDAAGLAHRGKEARGTVPRGGGG